MKSNHLGRVKMNASFSNSSDLVLQLVRFLSVASMALDPVDMGSLSS